MVTTLTATCPRHSPDKPVVLKVDEQFTRQGKLVVLTCVICGFSADKVIRAKQQVPTTAFINTSVQPFKYVTRGSDEVHQD